MSSIWSRITCSCGRDDLERGAVDYRIYIAGPSEKSSSHSRSKKPIASACCNHVAGVP
jgi:hypothetical protein